MPRFQAKRTLPYTSEQLYALVTDVAAYPEFLPGCKQVIIHTQRSNMLEADLVMAWGPVTGRFFSHVSLTPCREVRVVYSKGPFKSLESWWRFEPTAVHPDGHSSTLTFFIDIAFTYGKINFLSTFIFPVLVEKIVEAFEKRVETLYHRSDLTVDPQGPLC